jgi:hypothetical protein
VLLAVILQRDHWAWHPIDANDPFGVKKPMKKGRTSTAKNADF